MDLKPTQPGGTITRIRFHQPFFYICIIILMSNLSSLVDAFLHPEIPYFDSEHIIVGGVTGLASCILLGLLIIHNRLIEKALKRIDRLESILPICANCKKIRIPNSDPNKKESWQPIESYITKKTSTRFTHGICPGCASALYPQISDDQQSWGFEEGPLKGPAGGF